VSLGHLPPRLSDAEALALGRLIEPELHAALVTVDAHGEIERLNDENEALRIDLAAAYCRMDDMEGLNDE
jgi:hypothetical protein